MHSVLKLHFFYMWNSQKFVNQQSLIRSKTKGQLFLLAYSTTSNTTITTTANDNNNVIIVVILVIMLYPTHHSGPQQDDLLSTPLWLSVFTDSVSLVCMLAASHTLTQKRWDFNTNTLHSQRDLGNSKCVLIKTVFT